MPTTQSGDLGRDPSFLRLESTIAWRFIVILLAGVLVVWLTLQVTVIAVAAFVGFAQAALLWPVVQRLAGQVPRVAAAIAVVAVYAAAIFLLGYFITMQMVNAWPQFYSAVVGVITTVNDWFVEQGWIIRGDFANTLEQELIARLGTLASGLGGVAITVMGVLGALSTIIVVSLFSTLFALIGGERMVQGLVSVIPHRRQLSTFAAVRDGATTARWWVIASAVTGAVDGLFIGLGLALLGVPLAVPIGLATFILAFIPMIGATVAGALAVAVALFFNGLPTAIWTLVLVLVVQQIEGNVLSPLLLSRAMNFPPLVTLLLSTGAGVAIGLPGLFLAVPVAGVLVAALKAWRRELPEDVKEARGIRAGPAPSFEELAARAAPRPPAATGWGAAKGGAGATATATVTAGAGTEPEGGAETGTEPEGGAEREAATEHGGRVPADAGASLESGDNEPDTR